MVETYWMHRKEDLNLYGNELNYIQTSFVVGNILSQIPSNLLLTRFPAHKWLPIMEITWSVLTFTLAEAKNVTHLCVIRFFIGDYMNID